MRTFEPVAIQAKCHSVNHKERLLVFVQSDAVGKDEVAHEHARHFGLAIVMDQANVRTGDERETATPEMEVAPSVGLTHHTGEGTCVNRLRPTVATEGDALRRSVCEIHILIIFRNLLNWEESQLSRSKQPPYKTMKSQAYNKIGETEGKAVDSLHQTANVTARHVQFINALQRIGHDEGVLTIERKAHRHHSQIRHLLSNR